MVIRSLIAVLFALCLLSGDRSWALAAPPAQVDGKVASLLEPAQPPANPECAAVTAIPVSECNALLDLYRTTNGAMWDNRTRWLETANGVTPCDWYGVACVDGHVTQLNLASNRLAGKLSRHLVYLPQLQRLDLADNLLETPLPQSICLLAERGVRARLDYNLLNVQNRKLRQCLSQMESDWRLTQTIPPLSATVAAIGEREITLTWQPIPYQADGGYYEISYTSVLTAPYTVHGVTSSKSISSYTLAGLTPGQSYSIRVRSVTPAHSQQENDLYSEPLYFSAVTRSEQKTLLMVYFPADNDLSPYAAGVLNRLKAGSKLNPTATIYYLVDQRGDHNTLLFVIANDIVTKTNIIQQVWGVDELDTMDPAVLSWFLSVGRRQVDASRIIVSLMGHGAGLAPEYHWLVSTTPGEPPKPQPGIPPLPRDVPPTPGDENNSSGFLSPIDYGVALNAATDNGANPFDVVFFDHCFAGNLDTLYQVRNTARAYVVSPNYAWLTAAYRAYLTQFAPVATPEQLARRIISIYQATLNDSHPNVIFWISNEEIVAIAGQVSELGVALTAALTQGNEEAILDASLNSKFIDTNQCGVQNLTLAPPDEMVGTSSFANNLRQRFAVGTPVHTAATALFGSLSNIESRVRTGTPYIAPETEWQYNNTVAILAPLARHTARNVAWRASVYSVSTPLTAVWSAVPTQTVQISQALAFVQDGKWDDFLNQWYTKPPAPTVGEWCNYTPPAIITDTVVETLALTVTKLASQGTQTETLRLRWEASNEDNIESYWLMQRSSAAKNWTAAALFDLSTTDYTLDLPMTTSATEFQLIGQDIAGATLAASNIILWPASATPQTIFLPLISKQLSHSP
jgi:hypothetical protein